MRYFWQIIPSKLSTISLKASYRIILLEINAYVCISFFAYCKCALKIHFHLHFSWFDLVGYVPNGLLLSRPLPSPWQLTLTVKSDTVRVTADVDSSASDHLSRDEVIFWRSNAWLDTARYFKHFQEWSFVFGAVGTPYNGSDYLADVHPVTWMDDKAAIVFYPTIV